MLSKQKFSPRALMRLSMASLLVFFALGAVGRFVPNAPFQGDLFDGVRGAFLGITLGFMFLMFRAKRA